MSINTLKGPKGPTPPAQHSEPIARSTPPSPATGTTHSIFPRWEDIPFCRSHGKGARLSAWTLKNEEWEFETLVSFQTAEGWRIPSVVVRRKDGALFGFYLDHPIHSDAGMAKAVDENGADIAVMSVWEFTEWLALASLCGDPQFEDWGLFRDVILAKLEGGAR